MRILFCSPNHLTKELGAPKVLIELAEEMEHLGWQCTLLGPRDIGSGLNGSEDYSSRLRRYLIENAKKYDVVEYDHGTLPYQRGDFPDATLFVARSVLLGHHFKKIAIPRDKSINGRIRSLLFGRSEAARSCLRTERAEATVKEADLVNVLNANDREELLSCGIPDEKIFVIPNGISRSRRILFDAVSSSPPINPVVTFIGTFDQRKGASDFPRVVEGVSKAMPKVRFSLLGTSRDERVVLRHFPRRLRNRIDVVPRFHPDALPELLSNGSVGIFPSYLEGFGIGILEMMAASIPVIAYDCPGPSEMLPSDCLVAPGDWSTMSAKVINLLNDAERLAQARIWAKERSQQFCWSTIARRTSEEYSQRCERRISTYSPRSLVG